MYHTLRSCGSDILQYYAGQDATQVWEMANHSARAKEMMASYFVGNYMDPELEVAQVRSCFLVFYYIVYIYSVSYAQVFGRFHPIGGQWYSLWIIAIYFNVLHWHFILLYRMCSWEVSKDCSEWQTLGKPSLWEMSCDVKISV